MRTLTLFSFFSFALASPMILSHEQSKHNSIVKRQQPLNAFLATFLEHYPAIGGPIQAVANELTQFERVLALAENEPTTYNDLAGPCKDYTIIYARGTTDPGNVGILCGPAFFDAVRDIVGDSGLAVQGSADYGATVEGYLEGGEPQAGTAMAAQISQAAEKCPNTKLIVSGYSQGAQIVHNAIKQLNASSAASINKVVLFGDPYNGQPLPNVPASKVKTFCNQGDNICVNGIFILVPHLIYPLNASTAAEFVTS